MLRLYLPVWAAVVFGTLCTLLITHADDVTSPWLQRGWTVTPKSVVKDLTLLGGPSGLISPLWSLQWEVWFSLLLPFAVWIGVRLARFRLVVIAACVAVIAVGANIDLGGGRVGSFMDAALTYLPMFGIGVALATALPRIAAIRLGPVAGTVLLAFAALAMTSPWYLPPLFGEGVGRGAFTPLATVGALGMVLAAIVFPPAQKLLDTRVAQWLGRISFSLYLVHEPIVVSTAYLFGDSGLAWAIPIAIAVSIVVAAGFYRAVEMPAHRLSRRVGDTIRRRQHLRRADPSLEAGTTD